MDDIRLALLKQLAKGLSQEFGNNCEVVIHDLSKKSLNKSIVYIENGHVTDRKVGGGPTGAVLDALNHHSDHLKDQYAYLTRTDNGRILKSTTIYIKDEHDTPLYVFAINYDITNLLAFEGSVKSLTDCSGPAAGKKNEPKHIAADVNELLDELIQQSVELVGVPVPFMTKEDKIKAIEYLNDSGAFLITKSGDKVSKYFGISKYTLYSYVNINK